MSPTVGEVERRAAQESERRRARVRGVLAVLLPLFLVAAALVFLARGSPWGMAWLALFLAHEFYFLWRAEAVEVPQDPWPWFLAAVVGIWAGFWAWGPPLTPAEGRALTETLRFCRPEAPGHAPSFLAWSLAALLPGAWAPVGTVFMGVVFVGTAFYLALGLAGILNLRPGLSRILIAALIMVSAPGSLALIAARVSQGPNLLSAVLILGLFRRAAAPGVGSGLPGFLWFLLLLNQPWTAVLVLPGILAHSLARPRLGSWASAFRGLPAGLSTLLVLRWARGMGKTMPGTGYSMDGMASALSGPWVEGWKAALEFRGPASLALGALGFPALVLALLAPLLRRGLRGFTQGVLYAQLLLALALPILLPALGPWCRPLWVLALPLAASGFDGAWDLAKTWSLRPRVAARMALCGVLAAALSMQAGVFFRDRQNSDGPALLEAARRVWAEAGPEGLILCDEKLFGEPLEYLEAFETGVVPKGAELLRFGRLGERQEVAALIEKRPKVLFSEFLEGNPAGVAQGIAAADHGRKLFLIGERPVRVFRGNRPLPRVLGSVVGGGARPSGPPDPASFLEDLPTVRGGPVGAFLGAGFVDLGRFFLAQGRSGPAFTAASRALDFDPGSAPARSLRQEVYEGSGHFDKARQGYEEILRRAPADVQARLDLARILWKKGDADEAALHFQEVLRLNQRAAEAYLGLGRIQAAKGETAGALASLERGLSLQPEDDDARLILARLYLAMDNPRAAEEHLRYLLEKKPDDRKIQELLGKALATKDRP